MEIPILLVVFIGIGLLLVQILYFKLPAFIALLISGIITGVLGGLSGPAVMKATEEGMASTLGFVATIVGLGAIFGGIMEKSGGAPAMAKGLIHAFGSKRIPSAMMMTGFILAIPIFFDVAFIILVPITYALQRSSGKSLLLFALPLLAGLATSHTFIPPTPGPVAVADIIGADLGWVIVIGLVGGIPAAIVAGLFYGKYIGTKLFIAAPPVTDEEVNQTKDLPSLSTLLVIMAVPMVLIFGGSIVKSGMITFSNERFQNLLLLIGHPFSALIFANILVWYFLGIKRGHSATELLKVSTNSFKPTGLIILCTGAGGVFKQVLIETGAGNAIAEQLSESGLPLVVFAFLAAVIIRAAQGSATVAMITAAGLIAPVVTLGSFSPPQLATLVLAIASGASAVSHVNDSGFWMVNQYLGLTEKQTFQTWTILTTLLALTGFVMSLVLFMIL